MIKVAVTGAAGRMGSGIVKKITEQEDMEVVAAIEIPNTPLAGKDVGFQAGIGELGVEIVGEAKIKIAVEDDEEPWDEIVDDSEIEESLNEIDEKVDEDYLDKRS